MIKVGSDTAGQPLTNSPILLSDSSSILSFMSIALNYGVI